jgi:hypothetical protein
MNDPVPFIDYLNAVDDLLEVRFGLTSRDADLEQIAAAQDAGETPEQFVEWFGEHHALEPMPMLGGEPHDE